MKKQSLLLTFMLCVLTLTCFTALTLVPVNGASSDAKILSYSWYQAPTNELAAYVGDLIVVGELQNVGSTNIFYVYVAGSAYIGDEKVASGSWQVFGNNLLPGQKAPFYLDFVPSTIFVDDFEDWADVTDVKVTVGYLANTDKSMYQGLTVSSEGAYRSGVYTVVGKFENVGTESVGDVRVITTFYNAAGTVVSLNYTDVFSENIAPGISKNFVATPVDYYSGDIASYDTLIQSTIQQPDGTITTNPSNTKAPSTSTTAPQNTQSSSSSSSNSFIGSHRTILIIIVILVAITSIGVILVLTNRDKHKQTTTSTETNVTADTTE
ncbi:MAG: FxLYD domain-containing protein [Nitrososphaerota archaeon]|nr:FxLYD domain-containing protein [Nitrososphaerota archaeon]